MTFRALLVFCFLGVTLVLNAQNDLIRIHSITNDRQPNGESGYTLDGGAMIDHSRPKLLNTALFGPSGTYTKSISITDGYGLVADLIPITSATDIDLFYFGSFNKPDFTANEFLPEEIDSLYKWSVNGGGNDHLRFFQPASGGAY